MTDAHLSQLRCHPRDFGYASQQLETALADLAWDLPNVTDSAKELLEATLDKAFESWVTLADRIGRPLPTIIRNLISCAEIQDLPVFRLALSHARIRNVLPADLDSAVILHVLSKAHPNPTVPERILSGAYKLGVADLTVILAHRPRKLTEVMLSLWPEKSATLADCLKVAAAYCGSTKSFRVSAGLNAVISVASQRGLLATLDGIQFAALDSVWRRAILASAIRRSSFLEEKLRIQLEEDPFVHLEMPEAIRRTRRCAEALGALKSRYFRRRALPSVLANPPEFAAIRDRVIPALSASPGTVQTAPNLADWTNALEVCRHDTVGLAALLVVVGGSLFRSGTRVASPEILAGALDLIADEDFARLCVACPDPARTKIFRTYARLRSRKAVVGVLCSLFSPAECLRILEKAVEWHDPSILDALPASPVIKPKDIAKIFKSRLLRVPLLRLAISLRRLKARSIFEQITLRGLVKAGPEEAALALDLIRQVRRQAGANWYATFLPRFLSQARLHVLRALDGHADSDDFAAILQWTGLKKPGPKFVGPLLALKNPAGNRLCLSHLAAGQDVPAQVTNAILRDRSLLMEALRVAPGQFLKKSLSVLSTQEALTALPRTRSGYALAEEVIGRIAIRKEIPWFRTALKTKPRFSAACEVAALVGLQHLGYLSRLGQRLATPVDETELGRRFDDQYRTYEIPKKAGGKRLITAPCGPMKSLQRALLHEVLDRQTVHPTATGFRGGYSIRENAAAHTGKRMVVNVDIESFFPSTSYERVLCVCRKILGDEVSPLAVRLVAEICCYGGMLPTGAPTSPVLANLILRPADAAIAKVAGRRGVSYSRYADDLTFSGNGHVLKILPFVQKVLADLGYKLDPAKTNIFRRGRRQVVTGLVVNEKPNIPRTLRRRLRAAVHHRASGQVVTWHGKPMGDAELLGRISFLNLVQPKEAANLRRRLKKESI